MIRRGRIGESRAHKAWTRVELVDRRAAAKSNDFFLYGTISGGEEKVPCRTKSPRSHALAAFEKRGRGEGGNKGGLYCP